MQGFYIYNTMSRSKELLEPLDPPLVKFYSCGPTVYDYAHIGNFRAYIFVDLLRRSLKINGYKIEQVMNITDVEDKIIARATDQAVPIGEITAPYIEAFFEDLDALRIERAEHYPRATDHMEQMVELIRQLDEKGLVYKSGESFYYRIADFPGYGRLSRLDTSGIRDGARVDVDEYDKESARDFVLWKGARDEPVTFDGGPYGRGRPGWHLECSAMAREYLGDTMDIHCGGVDLIFPHHENEIAQSEGATGEKLSNYWMHCEHLLVEGRKMSKSLGNFYTFRDLLGKGYRPSAVRYLLLSTNYRSQLNFTFKALEAAAAAVERLRDFKQRLEDYEPSIGSKAEEDGKEIIENVTEELDLSHKFGAALADDLDVSTALAGLFDFVREVNRLIDARALSKDAKERALNELNLCDRVLDVLRPDEQDGGQEDGVKEIETLIDERNKARREKNFARADEIRDKLAVLGIALEDGPAGTRWKRK